MGSNIKLKIAFLAQIMRDFTESLGKFSLCTGNFTCRSLNPPNALNYLYKYLINKLNAEEFLI